MEKRCNIADDVARRPRRKASLATVPMKQDFVSVFAAYAFELMHRCSSWDRPFKCLGQARSGDRPFKMLGTGPLLGQALENAWDRPALGTSP